jgi:hypothetical protein
MDELKAIHQQAKKFESELNKKLNAIKNDNFEDLQKKVQDLNNRNKKVAEAHREFSESLLKNTPPPEFPSSGGSQPGKVFNKKPSNNSPGGGSNLSSKPSRRSPGGIGKYLLGIGAAGVGEHIHSLRDKIAGLLAGHHDDEA